MPGDHGFGLGSKHCHRGVFGMCGKLVYHSIVSCQRDVPRSRQLTAARGCPRRATRRHVFASRVLLTKLRYGAPGAPAASRELMASIQRLASSSAPKSLQVAAAVIGNALEWYYFIIFGFLTVVISKLFFPTDSQYTSLLLTTATFGAGFLMRPLGGIFLGIYADRKGRKAALQLIIGLMTIAIAIITFAPTYAAIGVAAPLSILIARLLQGLATGGEWGCSTAFLIESAPAHRRGFYGSWQMTSQGLALLAGALVSFFVTRIFTPEAFESWGWRIPFLMGLLIGPVGIFIRRHLNETDAFLELRPDKQENQFVNTVATYFKELLVCIGLYSGGTISFYVILLYMPTFATTQLHFPLSEALVAQSVGLACMASLVPLFGALSDRIGRKPILIAAFLPYLGLAYPLFAWVHANPTFANLLIMQVVLCSFFGCFLWSDCHRTCGAISGPNTLHGDRHHLQRGGRGIRRFRTVLCHMVDRGHRFATCSGILCDVRCCNKLSTRFHKYGDVFCA